jgi:IMP dehydrogenase/GMP reductase
LLEGYWPNSRSEGKSPGGLKKVDIKNLKEAYRSRLNRTAKKRLTKNYQVVKVLENKFVGIMLPTYDLEIDCPTHSFIANNTIVHNSLCTTRIKTGNGLPQLTAISECAKAAKESGGTIIADGGIRTSGDIVKALAAGADAVMVGSLVAGTHETPGELVSVGPEGMTCKSYRGMASKEAQVSWKGYATAVEGELMTVPYRSNVKYIIREIVNGIYSGMSYQNAKNIPELRENAVFAKQTVSGVIEGKPHRLK